MRILVLLLLCSFWWVGCGKQSQPVESTARTEQATPATPMPERPHLVKVQESRTTLTLNKVFFINEQQGWVAGRNGVILHTADGGAQWRPQPSNVTENLIDLFFLNAKVGWAMSVNRLLATKDGGKTWQDIWDTSTINLNEEAESGGAVEFQAALVGFSFADARHGYAFALGWEPATGRYAVPLALTTTDGGLGWDWTILNDQYGVVTAIDSKTCVLAGKLGKIVQTTDGGKTWQPRSSLTEDDLRAVTFVSRQQGWAAGAQGTIISSADSGRTWSAVYRTAPGERPVEWHSIHFSDPQHGVAGGLVDYAQQDKLAYLLVLLRTSDGGRTWQKEEISGAYFSITSLQAISPKAAWAVGGNGQILQFSSSQ